MQCMHVYIPVSRACVPNHIYTALGYHQKSGHVLKLRIIPITFNIGI